MLISGLRALSLRHSLPTLPSTEERAIVLFADVVRRVAHRIRLSLAKSIT